jgi:hypothetical protein
LTFVTNDIFHGILQIKITPFTNDVTFSKQGRISNTTLSFLDPFWHWIRQS